MIGKWSIAFLFVFCIPELQAQVEKEGWMVLNDGDTLTGKFQYEKGRLFTGIDHLPEGGEQIELTADTLKLGYLEGSFYRSLFIPEEKAGVAGHALLERVVDGRMRLYKGHYASRSCSCQDLPSILKGAFIFDETDKLWLVKKNRWLDRIKNAEEVASAFLPFDDLVKAVSGRQWDLSGIGQAVDRYNERSKDLTRSGK